MSSLSRTKAIPPYNLRNFQALHQDNNSLTLKDYINIFFTTQSQVNESHITIKEQRDLFQKDYMIFFSNSHNNRYASEDLFSRLAQKE